MVLDFTKIYDKYFEMYGLNLIKKNLEKIVENKACL